MACRIRTVALGASLAFAACGEPEIIEKPSGETPGVDGVGSQDFGTADGAGRGPGVDGGALEPEPVPEPAEPAPDPGEFKAPCATNDDCFSGFCVVTADGKLCSKVCDEACPEGWNCGQLTAADPIFLCLPRWLHLCEPCATTSDCSGGEGDSGHYCIDQGAKGRFCGGECKSDGKCPLGYSCKDVPIGGGLVEKQCVPDSGECECSPLAIELQLETTCTVSSEFGACHGTRVCTPQGLTACDAQAGAAEACNGLDDDCDGVTDELAPDYPCSVTNAFGACPGKGSCVGGVEYCQGPEAAPEIGNCDGKDNDCDSLTDEDFIDTDADGQADCIDEDDDDDTVPDPIDNCPFLANLDQADADADALGDACDPDDDNDGTPDTGDCEPKDAAIEPGAIELCDQVDNDCDGTTDENLCDDLNPCTDDKCQGTECVHAANSAACDDKSKCTGFDQCEAGECKGFSPVLCDDGNPCTDDACDPITGKCTHAKNATACEDGSQCTVGDACQNGFCKSGAIQQCSDGNPCTSDFCEPTSGCIHKPSDGAGCISSSGKCPTGTCVAGTCLAKPGIQCKTEVGLDLCQEVEVTGSCDAAGNCNVNSAPPGYTCPGCAGICIKCFIEFCIPFGAF